MTAPRTERRRLPNRRRCTTFSFQCNDLQYSATFSRFADGRLAEIFSGPQSFAPGKPKSQPVSTKAAT